MMNIPKTLAATAVAAALALPAYAQTPAFPPASKTSFEKQKQQAIFMAPGGLGLFSALSLGLVQSIQQVNISLTSAQTTNAATITAVNTSCAMIVFNGQTSAATSNYETSVHAVALTNATTVTATKYAAASASSVCATIVEFKAWAVKSLQAGSVSLSGLTGTATISSVTTANALCIYNGNTCGSASATPAQIWAYAALTNATTVTCGKGSSSVGVQTACFQVVEFNAGVLRSGTQQILQTCTPSTTNVTISAVNTGSVFIAWGGYSDNNTSTGTAHNAPGMQLTGATNLQITQSASASGTVSVAATVVEFSPQFIKSIQRGSVSIASGGTANTATVTAVNTLKAFVNYLGVSYAYVGGVDPHNTLETAALTNATTVTWNVNAADTTNTGWHEVIELI